MSDDVALSALNLKRAVVATTLTCRGCGYDLRGCRLDVNCPECGLAVRATLVDAVDPESSELPRLKFPRAVGNALVWLLACMLGAAACIILPPTAATMGDLLGVRARELTNYAPWWLHLVGSGWCVASLASCYVFHLPRGSGAEARVDRSIRWIAIGMVTIGVAAVVSWLVHVFDDPASASLPPTRADALIAAMVRVVYAVGGVAALYGTGSVLHEIGRRSRVYRRAQGGRQSTRAMIAAVMSMAAGVVLSLVAMNWRLPWLEQVAMLIMASSVLMILIGLVYLVVNGLWIRGALHRPSHRWRDVIRIETATVVTMASPLPSPPTDAGPTPLVEGEPVSNER